MKVSIQLAQNIVESMKSIIKQDINFIDTDCMIIASTDPKRVGTFHAGAKTVVEKNQMLIVSPDDSYEGTRPGINVPVHVNGEMIAVIGITGDPQQVTIYGNILRKMTEILVLEDEVSALRQREVDRSRMLLEDLIFYPENFKERWEENTLENWRSEDDYKRIVSIRPSGHYFDFFKDLRRHLEVKFATLAAPSLRKSVIWMEHEQQFVILYKSKIESLITTCLEDCLEIAKQHDVFVTVAVGSKVYRNFKKSYKDALLVLENTQSGEEQTRSAIVHYDDLTIELLFNTENTYRQELFCHKVLQNLSQKEVQEFHHILQLFGEHNGSIVAIAGALFIHKNTLQYQLQKLKRLTGYDMRRYEDFMILRIAFSLYEKYNYELITQEPNIDEDQIH